MVGSNRGSTSRTMDVTSRVLSYTIKVLYCRMLQAKKRVGLQIELLELFELELEVGLIEVPVLGL